MHDNNPHPYFKVKGYYFTEDAKVIPDTLLYHSGHESMIEHQRMWSERGVRKGYLAAEMDEISTIRTNYPAPLSDKHVITIVNDRDLMSEPLYELFPDRIATHIIEMLEAEYITLKERVFNSRASDDCSSLFARMADIQKEVATHTHLKEGGKVTATEKE